MHPCTLYIDINIFIYIYMYLTYINPCAHAHKTLFMCIYVYIYIYTYTVRASVDLFVYSHRFMHIHIYMHAFHTHKYPVYTYMHISYMCVIIQWRYHLRQGRLDDFFASWKESPRNFHPQGTCGSKWWHVLPSLWPYMLLGELFWPHCDLTVMISKVNYPKMALFQVSEIL